MALTLPLLWERMQQIERCRHRAEIAERKARAIAHRAEMADIAREWRSLAREYETLLGREEAGPEG